MTLTMTKTHTKTYTTGLQINPSNELHKWQKVKRAYSDEYLSQTMHYRLRAIRGDPLGVVNFASHFKQNSYFHFLIHLFLLKSL